MVLIDNRPLTLEIIYKRILNPNDDIPSGHCIEIESDFQRGDEETGVWDLKAKQQYISSVRKNYPTGILTFVKPHMNTLTQLNPWKVLDGGNRSRALRDFISLKIPDEHCNYFNEWDDRSQAKFLQTNIPVQELTLESEDPPETIAEMFTRLNTSAKPLSQGELIKSHGWMKDKKIIEIAKYFIGDNWITSFTDTEVYGIKVKWNKVFCKNSKISETTRCDSLAMICGYFISALTENFVTFDKRYTKLKDHLNKDIVQSDIDTIVRKIDMFLDIMDCAYSRDIFGKISKGFPSRKFIAPVWKKICEGNMTDDLSDNMKKFYKDILEDIELKNKYIKIRDEGTNGETNECNIGKLIDMIRSN